MSDPGRQAVPRLARRCLEAVLPADEKEPVLDPMDELFEHRLRTRGLRAARWWYRREVAGFVVRMARERLTGGGGSGGPRGRRDLRGTTRSGGGGRGPGGGVASGWGPELRQAIRRLGRAPLFSGASIFTVAVGIGLFTAVYGVVDSVLLDPLPYDEPEELVLVWRDYSAWLDLEQGWLGGPDIEGLRERPDVFSGVVALQDERLNLTGRAGDRPREVRAMLTSDNLLRVLGIDPVLGRGFLPGDDGPEGPGAVVLGHALWQGWFGGDPGVVGREIHLNGRLHRVVGVVGPDVHFAQHSSLGDPAPPELYATLELDLGRLDPRAGSFAGLARVREGAPPEAVEAALAGVAREVDRAMEGGGLRLWSVPLKDELVSGARPALLAVLGAAGFLLLILASNLATLFLGRTVERTRDLSVRAALGAGRARLVRTVGLEAVLVAGLGGLLGILAAGWTLGTVEAWAPPSLPRRTEIGLDGGVVLLAWAGAVGVGLAASLAGSFRVLAREPGATLRETGARGATGLTGVRTRRALVAAQAALCLTLLIGAGLLGRAFTELLRADPGFDARSALTFGVPLDPGTYPDAASAWSLYDGLRRRFAALPGVSAAGGANALPLRGGEATQLEVSFPGAPGNTGVPERDQLFADVVRATPGYERAAGLRLLEGRFLREGDDPAGEAVAVIDDVLARRFFPGRSPVGAPLRIAGDTVRVIGVVDQARLHRVHADDRGQVYRPFAQMPGSALSFVLRGPGDPSAVAAAARAVVEETDPSLPVSEVRTLEAIVEASLSRERLSVVLVSLFALGALTLASLGIYGVVAGAVASRTREVGIRMALGAEPGRVVGILVRQGLTPALVGAAAGLVGGAVVGRFLEGTVPGVDPADPLPYAVVAGVAVAVALTASWLPARRATRIDPTLALRSD